MTRSPCCTGSTADGSTSAILPRSLRSDVDDWRCFTMSRGLDAGPPPVHGSQRSFSPSPSVSGPGTTWSGGQVRFVPSQASAMSNSSTAARQILPTASGVSTHAPAPSQFPKEHPGHNGAWDSSSGSPQEKSARLHGVPAATPPHVTVQQPVPAGPSSHTSPGSVVRSPQVVDSSAPVTLPEKTEHSAELTPPVTLPTSMSPFAEKVPASVLATLSPEGTQRCRPETSKTPVTGSIVPVRTSEPATRPKYCT